MIEDLVKRWSDPTDPRNRLKRKTKRECLFCGEKYVSEVSTLADSHFCSDYCEASGENLARELGWKPV